MVVLTPDGFVHVAADGTLRDPIPLPGPHPSLRVEEPQLVLRGLTAFGAWLTTASSAVDSGRAMLVTIP
jgi:hypothetical protein